MAAAAQLAERKIPFQLFEAGRRVGANILDWGHVRVFSPWRYNIDKAAERLLSETSWLKPDPEGLPTGKEFVDHYLSVLGNHPLIKPQIHLSAKVVSITRKGIDKVRTAGRDQVPFLVKVQEGDQTRTYEAASIIDASGTWQNPNPLGAGGVPANGEAEHWAHIAYRIPDVGGVDKLKYAGKTVMVIGAGHSATNSLLDLARLKDEYQDTKLHWVLRSKDIQKIYGGKEKDALEARGALGIRIEELVNAGTLEIHTPYHIHEVTSKNGKLSVKGYLQNKYNEVNGVDEIIVNTGARPDTSMLREVRVQVDPALECVPGLAELIDPNVHSCGTVRPHGELELRQPEPNFYLAGVKSYGRAPTFLMATGYEQVRLIVAYLDGDIEAARRVELDLPETGVCSSDAGGGSACCVPAAVEADKNEAGCCGPTNTNTLSNTNTRNMEKTEKVIAVAAAVTEAGCCGGAPTSNADACCALDEQKKEEGLSGCGCNEPAESAPAKATACCS